MIALLQIILLIAAAKVIQDGWLPLLFLIGVAFYYLLKLDKKTKGDSVENLFAALFGLIVVGGGITIVASFFN